MRVERRVKRRVEMREKLRVKRKEERRVEMRNIGHDDWFGHVPLQRDTLTAEKPVTVVNITCRSSDIVSKDPLWIAFSAGRGKKAIAASKILSVVWNCGK